MTRLVGTRNQSPGLSATPAVQAASTADSIRPSPRAPMYGLAHVRGRPAPGSRRPACPRSLWPGEQRSPAMITASRTTRSPWQLRPGGAALSTVHLAYGAPASPVEIQRLAAGSFLPREAWERVLTEAQPRPRLPPRRDGRAADCTGLENRSTRKGTQGSNPCLSASIVAQNAAFISETPRTLGVSLRLRTSVLPVSVALSPGSRSAKRGKL
jgi:hypothetical protein